MIAAKTWSTPANAGEKKAAIPCALCGGAVFRPHYNCGDFGYVRCVQCGLVQINPQPEKEEVAARYGTRSGNDYLSYEIANEKAFLVLQELALRDAGFFKLEKELFAAGGGLQKNQGKNAAPRCLDIGCATGALIASLAKRGWNAGGLEISAPQAEYCQKRRLEVHTGSLEEASFESERFDVVLASHLIEHLNSPAAFVREARRVLKKGGRFYVTTPDIDGLQSRLFKERWRSAIFDHLYLFSGKTLSALLAKNGFKVELRRSWGGLAAGAAPKPLKAAVDKAAKIFGFGDVMIIRAQKV